MIKEEKQKAIDALKISVPVRPMTHEEFNDYIQTLKKIMDWLEQDPCEDAISRKAALEKAKSYNTDGWDMYTPLVVDVEDIEELPPVTPKGVTVTDFADRCRECGKQKTREHDKNVALDKIKAEIQTKYGQCKLTEYIVQYDGICTSANVIGNIADILQIIDKVQEKSEEKE